MALIDDLRISLQTRLSRSSDGSLTFQSGDLLQNSNDLVELLELNELVFGTGSVSASGSLEVRGSLTMWGLNEHRFVLEISETTNGLFFKLYPETLPPDWAISKAFPSLRESLLDAMPQSDFGLVALSSTGNFGSPAIALDRGVHYITRVSPTDTFAELQALIPQGAYMHGRIEKRAEQHFIQLQTTISEDKTYELLGFDPVTIKAPTELYIKGTSLVVSQEDAGLIYLKGTAHFSSFSFPALLYLPDVVYHHSQSLVLDQEIFELPSVSKLLDLASQDTFTAIFPDTFSVLNDLLLSDLNIAFANTEPSSSALYSKFTLKPDTAGKVPEWEILSAPQISIGNLEVDFAPAYHAYGQDQQQLAFSTTLVGHVKVGNTTDLGISLFVPLSGSWILEFKHFPTLTDLAQLVWHQGGQNEQAFLGVLPDGMIHTGQEAPDLELADLQIGFNPLPPAPALDFVSFELTQVGTWDIGGIGLKVSGWTVALRVDATDSNKISGLIHGFLQIGSVANIEGTFTIPASDGNWTVGLKEGTTIEFPGIGELLTTIGGSATPSGLPQGLTSFGHFSVQQLQIVFSPKPAKLHQLVFGMIGTADWVIVENILLVKNINAYLEINNKADGSGYEALGHLTGTVEIFRHNVLLNAYKDTPGTAWILQIVLQSNLHIPGLADLANAQWMRGGDLLHLIPETFVPFKDGFDITALNINFDINSHQLSLIDFKLQNSGPWLVYHNAVIVDGALFTTHITNFHQANEELTLHIEGTINIADEVVILLTADKSKTEQATDPTWTLSGSITREVHIGELIAYIGTRFGIPAENFPESVRDITLTKLTATYTRSATEQEFYFECDGKMPFGAKDATGNYSKEFDVSLKIDIKNSGTAEQPKFEREITGDLILKLDQNPANDLKFELKFDQTQSSISFAASYQSEREIVIQQLVALLSEDVAGLLPPSLSIQIRDAFFVFTRADGTDGNGATVRISKYLFGLDLGADINLTELPLVGKLLASQAPLGIKNAKLVVASQNFAPADSATAQHLLPAGIALPAAPIVKGVNASLQVDLGNVADNKEISLLMSDGTDVNSSTPAPIPSAGSTGNAPVKTPDSKAKWIDIKKTFGPATFDRIGFEFDKPRIKILLDASLKIAALTFSVDGLGVAFPIQKPVVPAFSIRGMSVDFKQGPLEIGGGFLATDLEDHGQTVKAYVGEVLVNTEALSLTAIGMYARNAEGHPSLFIFAVLGYPLGGPPYFFVTGLAAGFGINTSLNIPDVSAVNRFSLVQAATGGGGIVQSSQPSVIQSNIQAMQKDVSISDGQMWLAAGIKFKSFELIDSFALLYVSFGNKFEIALLGLSSLSVPSEVPEPLAYAELAILVSFSTDSGALKVSAQLTSASYILSRGCHITGGFAFYTWFGGDHEGDFVVSLGGYNPYFKKPDHYPDVPRLGINWQVNDNVSVKGGLYYALTPSFLMAGGNLDVNYQSGNTRAWFTAYANFLLGWKPFYYQAEMGIHVGASYRLNLLFTHKTITVHLGADVNFWGPEFGGKAKIDLTIFSVTVYFGSSSPRRQPISIREFESSFLPAATDVCKTVITGGLIKDLSSSDEPAPSGNPDKRKINSGISRIDWIVDPSDLELITNTVVPIKEAYFNPANLDAPETGARIPAASTTNAAGTQFAVNGTINRDFGIGPSDKGAANVQTSYAVRIQKVSSASRKDNYNLFKVSPVFKRSPKALWGNYGETNLQESSAVISDTLVGFRISTRDLTPDTLPPLDLQQFLFSETGEEHFAWSNVAIPALKQWPAGTTVAGTIHSSSARDNILTALKNYGLAIDHNITTNQFNDDRDDFLDEPVLSLLGQEGDVTLA